MLAYLPPLFFFAVLMGSPVPGFLVFMLLGGWHAWQSWRQPQGAHAFHWTREDTWLALCFMSIPLFKLLSLLWSPDPALALGNVAWHLYFLFWPFVLTGLARCNATQYRLDRCIALGLIVFAGISLGLITAKGHSDISALGNVGIIAQLLMVLGSWNLLAYTRPGNNRQSNTLFALAFIATGIGLILTTRRLELLSFVVLSFAILLYRQWHRLTPLRITMLFAVILSILSLFLALRWGRFVQGFEEISRYFSNHANGIPYVHSSWGSRLEMWRLGLSGFMDQPLLGLSASARPYGMPGAPPMDIFGHRHFHSQIVQTLVEGGLSGLAVFVAALVYSARHLIVKNWHTHRETALLAACLLGAYALEGTASAALVYDKPNAVLVAASAWCWLQTRDQPAKQFRLRTTSDA